MENVRNRLRSKLFQKDVTENNIRKHSEITFNGIHKSCENCDSYILRKNQVPMDKPIYLG